MPVLLLLNYKPISLPSSLKDFASQILKKPPNHRLLKSFMFPHKVRFDQNYSSTNRDKTEDVIGGKVCFVTSNWVRK